ncbi:hypothetical protein [Pontibacter akesuensis]|uniref:DUF4440 domain-containing protein n=1 Tax=Pontibacter akesuensis TaxID=388950 RepID=A0A1I7HZX6_9BACT|nr:hypothetical protein [Pontibacter akesuensis]GHA64455.1 hypothetical protein GCM10007389_16470 [Pontibacter akesuensis]SFU66264.1 hypothetical protein SAMN04487941_1808 [Pontibacter akesuensis]
MKKLFLILLLATSVLYTSKAQQTAAPQADVASIEAITAAGLKIISGPKGQQRDMEAFKALFLPNAQMGGVFYKGDSSFVRLTTVENFADRNGPAYAEMGFYENQLALRIERFGKLATAFQTYETRMGSPTGKVEDRGVNTYQLVYDQGRWWIASLLFTPETATQPIPKKYLK